MFHKEISTISESSVCNFSNKGCTQFTYCISSLISFLDTSLKNKKKCGGVDNWQTCI